MELGSQLLSSSTVGRTAIVDLGEIYRGLIFWACIGLHMVVLLWHVLPGGLMLGCFQLSEPAMPVSYTIL
jgi:hypothetical protein